MKLIYKSVFFLRTEMLSYLILDMTTNKIDYIVGN